MHCLKAYTIVNNHRTFRLVLGVIMFQNSITDAIDELQGLKKLILLRRLDELTYRQNAALLQDQMAPQSQERMTNYELQGAIASAEINYLLDSAESVPYGNLGPRSIIIGWDERDLKDFVNYFTQHPWQSLSGQAFLLVWSWSDSAFFYQPIS